MSLSEQRKKEVERLLRCARQRVDEDDRYVEVITRCKRMLGADQPGRDLAKERWAETMWR